MLSPEQLESAKQKGTELGTAAFVKGLTPVEIVDERVGWSVSYQVIGDLQKLVEQEG